MSTSKVLLGALAGIALGALAGLLLAPESGSQTRKKIKDKGNSYVDEYRTKFEDFLETLTDKFEGVKKEAKEFAENGKAKFEDAKKEARYASSDGKQIVS